MLTVNMLHINHLALIEMFAITIAVAKAMTNPITKIVVMIAVMIAVMIIAKIAMKTIVMINAMIKNTIVLLAMSNIPSRTYSVNLKK